jgi:hypothetical protein
LVAKRIVFVVINGRRLVVDESYPESLTGSKFSGKQGQGIEGDKKDIVHNVERKICFGVSKTTRTSPQYSTRIRKSA